MKFNKMESSNENERKMKVKTQAKVLGKTEVEWEIEGWNGPMGHQLRSRATCHVTVPTSQPTNSELRLRFHLKPYQSHEEPDQKFCNQRVKYVSRSIDCSCYTCKTVPLSATTAELPPEFMPKCPTRSAGYSLLVDVLNAPQNEVTLGVSGKILNGNDSAIPFQNFVTVDPASSQKDISVVDNFCPMVKWTEDKSGNISNCVKTTSITDEDARFVLTVTAYRIEEIGTNTPSPTTTAVSSAATVKPTTIIDTPVKVEVDVHDNLIWNGTLNFLRKDDGENSSESPWKIIATCKAKALYIEEKNAEMTGNGWPYCPSKLNIEVRRPESVVVSDGKWLVGNCTPWDIIFALGAHEEDDYDDIHNSIRKIFEEHVGIVLFNENADTEAEGLSTAASLVRGLLFMHENSRNNFWGLILKDEPVSRAIIRKVKGGLEEEKTNQAGKKMKYYMHMNSADMVNVGVHTISCGKYSHSQESQ